MNEEAIELRAKIDGLQLVVEVFLGAPLNRQQFRHRFADMLAMLRQNNAHAATIETLAEVIARLSDEQ